MSQFNNRERNPVFLHLVTKSPDSIGIIGNYPDEFVSIINNLGGIICTWDHRDEIVTGWIMSKSKRCELFRQWGNLNRNILSI